MGKIEEYLKEKPALVKTVVGYPMRGEEVLLGLRKRVSWGLGENLISGIGGKVEEGETEDAALEREFAEEIDVGIKECHKMGEVTFLFPNKPKWNQVCTVYLIDRWKGEPKETEVIKPLWFDKEALPDDKMWDDGLYFIPKVLAGIKIQGMFLYNEENNKVEEHRIKEVS